MAENKLSGLDYQQILLEARQRWLRAAEICEILKNHERLTISQKPAQKPKSGSLFFYDRKKVRFRKDGYRWKKTKAGKTVKEGHEKLMCKGVLALNCYYAHAEENENFQRRSYWMLEEDLSRIVLVHYRDVKVRVIHVSVHEVLARWLFTKANLGLIFGKDNLVLPGHKNDLRNFQTAVRKNIV